jgi:hypothetical protein
MPDNRRVCGVRVRGRICHEPPVVYVTWNKRQQLDKVYLCQAHRHDLWLPCHLVTVNNLVCEPANV